MTTRMRTGFRLFIAALVAAVGTGGPIQAQDITPTISIELNSLKPSQGGCQIIFVVKNDLGKKLEKVSYEVVLFNSEGLVDRMTIFDFQTLSIGKTKVRQFNLTGTDCTKINRVLINGAKECKGADADACMSNLTTNNRTAIEFGS
ncbi:MAG: hypothetical protein JKX91_12410 [Rhizobiaceae bacterium]|nr:hypothetical protein [Rhizobiaceae bacterium]